ncbi:MAG: hypothetical protein JNK84_05760 [Phreatobacter sp.]|uniref:hypothetical protein n=1 Tax=Phreatobacter sp. TaxID=1966341 RepID=UPI001A42C94F|nr:hypothetical protein [Phreatobacter sp.]MBL8568572.1 hypothetical protein [Phreatobacter sp.]
MLSIRAAAPVLLLLSAPAVAQPRCHAGSLEQLGRDVAAAFTARSMAGLAARLPDRPVSLIIQHSLNDRTDRLTVRLGGLDARLDRVAGRQEPRGRQVLDGIACSGAVCRFGPSGILHNNLYLKEIGIVRQGGCLTVSRIRLIDGD